jgi:hypothetical protein
MEGTLGRVACGFALLSPVFLQGCAPSRGASGVVTVTPYDCEDEPVMLCNFRETILVGGRLSARVEVDRSATDLSVDGLTMSSDNPDFVEVEPISLNYPTEWALFATGVGRANLVFKNENDVTVDSLEIEVTSVTFTLSNGLGRLDGPQIEPGYDQKWLIDASTHTVFRVKPDGPGMGNFSFLPTLAPAVEAGQDEASQPEDGELSLSVPKGDYPIVFTTEVGQAYSILLVAE